MDAYPHLTRLSKTLGDSINIDAVEPDILKEIQQILKNVKSSQHPYGYYTGDVDGRSGANTRSALAAFKDDHWLQFPDLIGRSTILALLEMADGAHNVSEQADNLNQKPLPADQLGQRTGASMRLPDGRLVYANELISPGCYLTWGEFTKDCSRPLEENYQIANAIAYARAFGWVRQKWGSPIGMTSGFRPPSVNRAVGGASQSQHLYAAAGDIYPLDGSLYELLKVVKVSPFTGVGLGMCKGFVHTDVRKSTTPADKIVFGYGC